jgi:hypothetical protein
MPRSRPEWSGTDRLWKSEHRTLTFILSAQLSVLPRFGRPDFVLPDVRRSGLLSPCAPAARARTAMRAFASTLYQTAWRSSLFGYWFGLLQIDWREHRNGVAISESVFSTSGFSAYEQLNPRPSLLFEDKEVNAVSWGKICHCALRATSQPPFHWV